MDDDEKVRAASRAQSLYEQIGRLGHAADETSADITQALASMLREFHDDRALWKQLENDRLDLTKVEPQTRVQLRAAVAINWADFLVQAGHRPPPPADVLAMDFRDAIDDVIADPASVDVEAVRRRVGDLADRLARTRGNDRAGLIRRASRYVRAHIPTFGRVALVQGAAAGAGAGATAVFSVAGPVVAAAAAAATRLAAVKILDAALPRAAPAATEPHPYDVARHLAADVLRPEVVGRHGAAFTVLGAVRPERPPPEVREGALTWLDRALAVVLLLWESGDAGWLNFAEPALDRACRSIGALRIAILDRSRSGDEVTALAAELADELLAVYAIVGRHD